MSNCQYEYTTLGAWPASFGDGTGVYTTTSASVSVTVGESAFMSVRTPTTSPRNRWLWNINTAQTTGQKAFEWMYALRSCANGMACTDPRPSTAAPAWADLMYDFNTAVGASLTSTFTFSPRAPQDTQRPFRAGTTPYYPECVCLSNDNVNQANLVNESWWVRGVSTTGTNEQGALVASTVTATASVQDLCSGRGVESPITTSFPICACDAGWFGTACGDSPTASARIFRACCSDHTQLLTDNVIYTFTTGSRNALEQQALNQIIYTYTSPIAPSAGLVYTASMRLRTLQSQCFSNNIAGSSQPRVYFTAICDNALEQTCAQSLAVTEGQWEGATVRQTHARTTQSRSALFRFSTSRPFSPSLFYLCVRPLLISTSNR